MQTQNDSASAEIINSPPTQDQASAPQVYTILSDFEFWLSISILLFGLVVLVLEINMIKSNKYSNAGSLKIVVITLIIISTLFLIAAGFNNTQIAPAIGLLGAIAGYLLGRSSNDATA